MIFVFSSIFFVNSSSLSYDLSTYPYPFIKNNTVVAFIGSGNNSNTSDGLSASKIFGRLWYDNLTSYENDAKSPKVVYGYEEKLGVLYYPGFLTSANIGQNISLIIIGGPCANEAAARLMNRTMNWPECAESFELGKGIIKLFEVNNTPYLLVAGYHQEDTEKAAYVLGHYLAFSLNGTTLEVTGEREITKIRQHFNVGSK